MPVGDKYAFLQLSDSVKTSTFANGTTVTFSIGAQPNPAVRVQNLSTAGIWVAMGTQSTTSASVLANGMRVEAVGNPGCIQVFRTGGQTKIAAFTENATHTVQLLVTGGEGLAS